MNRGTRVFDRTLVLLLSALVVVVGVAGVVWCTRTVGWLPWPGFVDRWPGALSTSALRDLAAFVWWPWAVLASGVLLMAIGLRWLVAHLPRRRLGYLSVGDDTGGKLLVDARSVVDAAALALNAQRGVDTAVGSLDIVDGQLIARIALTVEADVDLAELARRADTLSAQLGEVTGRDDLRMSFLLRTTSRTSERVE